MVCWADRSAYRLRCGPCYWLLSSGQAAGAGRIFNAAAAPVPRVDHVTRTFVIDSAARKVNFIDRLN